MSGIYLVVLAYCLGTLVSWLLSAPLWWVSLAGVVPLLIGVRVGYISGVEVTTQHYRRMMRNKEPS